MIRKNLLFIIILLISACTESTPEIKEEIKLVGDGPVKNVILMIGDGMGLAQVNAARLKAKQQNRQLTIDRLPVSGLVTTHSNDHLSTDSAAAATALASGYKTNNGMIGLSPQGAKLKTLLEMAKEAQLATGIIATSSVTHATPAAFATHVQHRSEQDQIAEQLLSSELDLILGGGLGFFLPKSDPQGLRQDEQDLRPSIAANGYQLIQNKAALSQHKQDKILGLFAKDGLLFKQQEPSLVEMTDFALQKLSKNKHGFILIIEASQIDWAAHYNQTEKTLQRVLHFDEAISTALAFAQADGETLLLVSADHETGGMAITAGQLDGSQLEIHWASKHHTPIDVPLFAYGPYALSFTGVQDNTQIPQKLFKLLNF